MNPCGRAKIFQKRADLLLEKGKKRDSASYEAKSCVTIVNKSYPKSSYVSVKPTILGSRPSTDTLV